MSPRAITKSFILGGMIMLLIYSGGKYFGLWTRLAIEGIEMRPTEGGVIAWKKGQGYRLHYKASKSYQPWILSINSELKFDAAYPGFLGKGYEIEDGALVLPPLDKEQAHLQGASGKDQYFLVFVEQPQDLSDEQARLKIKELEESLAAYLKQEEANAEKLSQKIKNWIGQIEADFAGQYSEPQLLIYTIEE